MANSRPEVSLKPSAVDLICLGAIVFLILYTAVYVGWGFHELPESIPTHFQASGQADSYGSKSTLLILLALEVGLSIMMFVVSRFPHKHNYLVQITQENAARIYSLSVSMLHTVNLWITLFFTYLIIMSMRIANEQSIALSNYALYVFIGGLTVLVISFLWKTNKAR